MNNSKKKKIGAVVLILIGSMLTLPMSGAIDTDMNENDRYNIIEYPPGEDEGEPVLLDTYYAPEVGVLSAEGVNDIGYNTDI